MAPTDTERPSQELKVSEDTGAEYLYLTCDCGHMDHVMAFVYYPWDLDDWPFFFVSMHIAPTTPLFKRIWKALRYIVRGEKMPFGHWHEILLNEQNIRDVHKLTGSFISTIEERELGDVRE